MRKTLCATALVTVALLGAGCKKGPDIVGKWNAPSAANVEFDFKADKTFTMGLKLGTISINTKGDYALEGDTLTLTVKDIDAPGAPPQAVAAAKQNPNFGKPQTLKIKFASDDEISLTPPSGTKGAASPTAIAGGGAMTLKRVKEGS